jgi:hypothetical protein
MIEPKYKLGEEKFLPILLTQESNKLKSNFQETILINSEPLGNTISSHFIKKISSLKDDILKYKYPINHHLAHKIRDVNDVNRMLKPSQFIIKNNTKYLKDLKIDLYEKSENEMINYPQLKPNHHTEYERDKNKLYNKISMNNRIKSGLSSTLANFSLHNNIEVYPMKVIPPKIKKSERFINTHTQNDNNFEHNFEGSKIKQNISKLSTNNYTLNNTLITQQIPKIQSHEEKKFSIKNIDFSNKIQLNFNKRIKKRKGKLKVFKSSHRKSFSSNSTDIKQSTNNKCNLDELGERTLILAKLIYAKNKKKNMDLEKISEIKYKLMTTDFKRSRFLEE